MDRDKDHPWGKCCKCGNADNTNEDSNIPGTESPLCAPCREKAQVARSEKYPNEVPYVWNNERTNHYLNMFMDNTLPVLDVESAQRVADAFEDARYNTWAKKLRERYGKNEGT